MSGRRQVTTTPYASRRGTIYLYVLIMSSLVSVIGLAALIGVRVQRKAAAVQTDGAQARTGAHSAIELGMLWLRDDPAWRSGRGAPWGSQIELGETTLTVNIIDPADDDLRNNDTDPVYLVGSATKGDASHTTAVGVLPTSGLGALEVSVFGNTKLHIHEGQLTSDQIVGSNGNADAHLGAGGSVPSNVYADVEVGLDALGDTYHGQVITGVGQRELPDPATVISAYQAIGTTMTFGSVPLNLLDNPDFETTINPWLDGGGRSAPVLTRVSGDAAKGTSYLSITGRSNQSKGPEQDLPRLPSAGDTLDLAMQVRMTRSDSVEVTLDLTFSGGSTTLTASQGLISAGSWTPVSLQFSVPNLGTVTGAVLTMATTDSNDDFEIDDVVLTQVGVVVPAPLTLRDTLFAPTVNDFGVSNADGVFIIDCAGEVLTIENCRIVGTLVVLNPGPGSTVKGSVAWEPARPNYPALIADGNIDIATTADPLSEATLGVNLNPAEVPYPYTGKGSDEDTDDVFPSTISGLVYSTAKIRLWSGVLHGVIMAEGEVEVKDGNVVVSYSNIHANDPPPGFDATVRDVEIIAGTWVPIVGP